MDGRALYEAQACLLRDLTGEDSAPWAALPWHERDRWESLAHDVNLKDREEVPR